MRGFVGQEPTSAIGRLALARVEMGEGNRAYAESEVRAVWQSSSLTAETETAVQTLVAVRDKVISAYEDILKMPI